MYLIVGILWLIVGAGILLHQARTGDQGLMLHLGSTSLSAGWLLLLLSAYNFARWWTRRGAGESSRQTETALRDRRLPVANDDRPRDPNFNFTDETLPPTNPSPPRPS